MPTAKITQAGAAPDWKTVRLANGTKIQVAIVRVPARRKTDAQG